MINNRTSPFKKMTTDYDRARPNTFFPEHASNSSTDVLPTRITTTLANNQVSKIEKDYDSSLNVTYYDPDYETQGPSGPLYGSNLSVLGLSRGLVTELREYSLGTAAPGPLVRCTRYSYKALESSAYMTANILDLPTKVSVYGGACGTSTLLAQTMYGYDESSLQPSGVTTQRDPASSNSTVRGNLTSTVQGIPGDDLVNRGWTFYDTGLPYTVVDGRGLVTTYKYSSAYAGAFLTETDLPDTTSGTASIAHVVYRAHDLSAGLPTSLTDQNGSVTTEQYDLLARIKSFTSPATAAGTAVTTFTYPDINHVHSSVLQGASTVTSFDGLGRKRRVSLGDASGDVLTDFRYDSSGRLAAVTNPYRLTPGAETVYRYDVLGRLTSETAPGPGGARSWDYNGNIVHAYDENQMERTLTYNVFGDLLQVVDGAAAGSLQTDYAYSSLQNLTHVYQHDATMTATRQRDFTYGSLSRIKTSQNPETGTICYGQWSSGNCVDGYDGNSNLRAKTDGRGVTTSYSYDALNRMTSKSYSDGTRAQHFSYDGKDELGHNMGSPWNVNAVGRLAHTSDGISVSSNFAYDAMGRLSSQADCVSSGQCNQMANEGAVYDLAGNMTQYTYPDGRVVQQSFDGAGRMSSVSYASWLGTQKNTSYFDASLPGSYDPAGHLVGGTFGNGVGLVAAYDMRQRIGTLAYGTTSQLLWGRNYGWTPNSNMSSWTDIINGTQRQFGYDSLNRLTSAVDFFSTSGTAQGQTNPSATYPVSIRFTNDACNCGDGTPNDDRNLYVQSVTIGGETVAGGSGWSVDDPNCNWSGTLRCMGTMTANFHQAGPVKITAYGTTAYGVGPHMQVLVNNAVVGEWDVTATSGTYTTTSSVSNAPNTGATPVSTPPQWTDPDESNLLINADTLGASGWDTGNVTVTGNVYAPDGSPSAYRIQALTDSWVAAQATNQYLLDGLTMTGSVWLRSPSGSQTVNLYLIEQGSAGLNTPASKQITLTTQWQQFQVSGMYHYGHERILLQIGGANSFPSGHVFEMWGAKLEDSGGSGRTVTNFLLYSQRLTGPSWSTNKASLSGNLNAPDGTNSASQLNANADDGFLLQTVPNPTPFSGADLTASVWLRSAAGSITTPFYILTVGSNGWTACGRQLVTVTSNWTRFQVSCQAAQALTLLAFQVGGESTLQNGASIQIWGGQLELASSAGPYVATGATAASTGTNLTNILQYSSQVDAPTWISSQLQIVPNAVFAPDGSKTGAELIVAAGPYSGLIRDQAANPALYDGAQATGSVFLRVPGAAVSVNLYFFAQNAQGIQFVGQQAVSLDNNWRRFSITATLPTGLTLLGLATTATSGATFDMWGAQVELAPRAGLYVPTGALPVLSGQELTNILPSSQPLSGPSWGLGNASASQNSALAPDGTNTAATLTANPGNDSFAATSVPNPSLYDGQIMTESVYLRVPSGSLSINLYMVNVANGTFNAPYNTITVTSAWQRFSFTQTVPHGLYFLALQVGGGGTFQNGQVLQVWGAQMVPGSSPAPYTPTVQTATQPASGQPGTAVPNGMNLQYAYDSFGNITKYGSFQPTYNAKNQMNGFAYDAAGNLLQTGTTALTWDAESRLSAAGGAAYLYDAGGNRVESTGVGITHTVYFNGRPMARYANGQWTDLIYGPQGLIAEVAGQESAEPQYRLADHLGTLVGNLAKNNVGQPVLTNLMDYTPFGQVFSGNTPDPFFFTGKERDAESGLDYFGARYYASGVGRWMSPDWVEKPEAVPYADLANPQSLNLYQYVNNNPLSRSDADGHCWPLCTIVAGAAAGAATGALIEAGTEYFSTGHVDMGKVKSAAIGGFVTGAIVGAAGPEAGIAAKTLIGAVGSITGGLTEKGANGEKSSATDVAVDAASGAIGPKVEKIAERTFATEAVQKILPKAIDSGVDALKRLSGGGNNNQNSGSRPPAPSPAPQPMPQPQPQPKPQPKSCNQGGSC